jgi:cytidylate kinase
MPGVRRLTIAIAGAPGAGKSTLASELAAKLNGIVSSFGDYVRYLAAEAGESTERANLQRIGQHRVEADAEGFVSSFLEWASPTAERPLIIDGVRHLIVDRALRTWAESAKTDYLLILLTASDKARAERRYGGNEADMQSSEDHPVERETSTKLPAAADIVIDAKGELRETLERIAEAVPEHAAMLLS